MWPITSISAFQWNSNVPCGTVSFRGSPFKLIHAKSRFCAPKRGRVYACRPGEGSFRLRTRGRLDEIQRSECWQTLWSLSPLSKHSLERRSLGTATALLLSTALHLADFQEDRTAIGLNAIQWKQMSPSNKTGAVNLESYNYMNSIQKLKIHCHQIPCALLSCYSRLSNGSTHYWRRSLCQPQQNSKGLPLESLARTGSFGIAP